MRRLTVAAVAFFGVATLAACGDDAATHELTPEMMRAPAASAPAATGTATGGATQAPIAGQAERPLDAVKQALLDDVRKRKFKNEDFVESETNRDPFRSFLSDFSGGQQPIAPQYDILMPKYSLDEIKLSMIVGPPTETVKNRVVPASGASRHVEPRAMFIDPTGMGVTVVRNKHISKADAKVVRIEPEASKVYVEIKEDLGNGKFRTVERVLELHAGEPATEGNP